MSVFAYSCAHVVSDFAADVLERIEQERVRKKISQQDVADLLGWTQSKVAQKLNQRSPTTLQELEALCFAVGLSKVEAVRDRGLEFVAEMTPTEMRILERLRQMPPPVVDAVMTLLRVRETTPPPEPRGATPRRDLFGKNRRHPD